MDGACKRICPAWQELCLGVCVETSSDPDNCGGCGRRCSPDTICQRGTCADACAEGLTSCQQACVDTSSHPQHCGACNNECPVDSVCDLGVCAAVCSPGLVDCDGTCVDPASNPFHCGSCGETCPSDSVCSSGLCLPACRGREVECAGACVDPDSNPLHCGACGNICGAGLVCSAGECGDACDADLTACFGACVDTATDPRYCGTCENSCLAGQVCDQGSCSDACSDGMTNCDGYCVDLLIDSYNCGACGAVCPNDDICSDGTCGTHCDPNDLTCFCDPVGQTCFGCTDCPVTVSPPNVITIHCVGTVCEITECLGYNRDVNGVLDDGCECVLSEVWVTVLDHATAPPRARMAKGDGNILGFVWEDHRYSPARVAFGHVTQNGSELEHHEEVRLSSSLSGQSLQPSLVWDATAGKFAVVWATPRGIKFVQVDTGGYKGTEVEVLEDWWLGSPGHPAIATARNGYYMLAWAEPGKIMAGSLDENGNIRYTDIDPDSEEDPWNYFQHLVTTANQPVDLQILGEGDNYLLVWQEGSGSSHSIRAVSLTYTGGSWDRWVSGGAVHTVSGNFSDARNPSLARAGAGAQAPYLLGFDALRDGGGREAWVAWLDSSGRVAAGPYQVSEAFAQGLEAHGGAAAHDPRGVIGAFWTYRNPQSAKDQVLYFRGFADDGTPLGNQAVNITEEVEELTHPFHPVQAVFLDGRFGASYTPLDMDWFDVRYATICPP